MDAVLKSKRSVVRTQTTKLFKKIETKLHESNYSEDDLEEFFAELDLREKELCKLDEQILSNITIVEDVESEVLKCDEYNTGIVINKSKVKKAFSRLKIPPDSNLVQNKIVENTAVRPFESPYVNLPRLTIEKFNGDPSDWQRFYDQFDSAINKNMSISNVDKFSYLRSYLTGVASDAIKGFSLTNNNYQAAMETLKERFGKKTVVINSHLNKLLNLTPVKKSSDIFALRKLLDTCQTEIRNLDALEMKSENYGSLLCPVLIKLLPQDIVLEIAKHCDLDDNWDVLRVLDILQKEITYREKAQFLTRDSRDREFSPKSNSSIQNTKNEKFLSTKNASKYPTASNLLNDTDKNSNVCLACNGEYHVLTECKVFSSYPLQRKKDFLMKYGFCFLCLKRRHTAKFCRSQVKCEICNRRHLKIMCWESKTDCQFENQKPDEKNQSDINNFTLTSKISAERVLLQTLIVRIHNNEQVKFVRCLIDSGSQKSYISKFLAKTMQYNSIGENSLTHSLFGGSEINETHKQYVAHLSNINNSYKCNFNVFDQTKICSDISPIEIKPFMSELKENGVYLSDVEKRKEKLLFEFSQSEIHILIGADVLGKLLTGKIKKLDCGLVCIETYLGWTVMGKTTESNCDNDSSMLVVSLFARSEKISDLWELDLLGIRDPAESKKRDDLNRETLDLFNSTVNRDSSGRYVVSLPWLKDHPPIPSNRKLAEKRLLSTVKSLKTSGNLDSYQTVFQDWLHEGIIKKIPDLSDTGHFLPHRAVIRQHATTPVRPVFDASAKEKFSYSLNDCLSKGPNLIELIPSILHRFRKGKLGVSADIKKAFCQIGLNINDQNFVKFLWYEDGDYNKLQVYQHCRVVFGINASPFLLAATLNHLFDSVEEPYKKIADNLKTSFYVDNFISSVDSTEELKEIIMTSKEILASAQFDLRGWQYTENDENLLEEDFLNDMKIESEENPDVAVMGLIWNKKEDTIKLMNSSNDNEKSKSTTKRSILSVINKIYDPIGYTAPAILLPKLILQRCWKEKFNWDSPLPEEMTKSFERWEEQLDILRNIKIPRRVSEIDLRDSEKHLHVFCDSSKLAYATCIFFRVQNGENISCQLIQAKTRVAPLKEVTIPRLELLACLIGARLANTIIKEMNINDIKIFYWTDAKNALFWIKNDGGWATFVQNRVNEIRKLTNIDNWYHVPSQLNPADLPSRGCSPDVLQRSEWWNGPEWLKKTPDFWPKSNISPDDEIIYSEKRKTVATALNIPTQKFDFYENCSSYKKMLKVTAWILRFYENAKKSKENRLLNNLTVEELNKAEYTVLKYAQRKCFSNPENKFNFPTLVDDKELVRVRTKISMRNDSRNFRYPIVLPADHNITSRIIEEKHKEMDHAGVQILMSSLREEFWIIRCRKTIRKILQRCIQCKRFSSKTVEVLSAPLPEDRVKNAGVFEIIGVDLSGPLFLKDGQKCWIVLYTCAVYRCVHLELATSLSTENFLQTLRRFIARRGRPHTIYSDNGTNLVAANKELRSVDWKQIEDYAAIRRINWKFNPPSAPWWGGFWERLIRIVKSILKRVLGKALLDYEELYTLICDTESIVNARPLTYISEDPNDLTPLTPEMFLKDIREIGVPDLDFVEKTMLKKRYAYRQKLREDLRQRFRNEYLGTLREFALVKKSTTFKEGDLVLIRDDNLKHLQWPMAKVLKVYKGKDGQFRVARLKTKNGELLRPFQRLCPLELNDETLPEIQQQTRSGRIVQPVQRLGVNSDNPG